MSKWIEHVDDTNLITSITFDEYWKVCQKWFVIHSKLPLVVVRFDDSTRWQFGLPSNNYYQSSIINSFLEFLIYMYMRFLNIMIWENIPNWLLKHYCPGRPLHKTKPRDWVVAPLCRNEGDWGKSHSSSDVRTREAQGKAKGYDSFKNK